MPGRHVLEDMWELLLLVTGCFSLSFVAAFFTQIKKPGPMPPWKQCIATAVYVGLSAAAFVFMGVHVYGMEYTVFFLGFSLITGLGSADLLQAIWSKVLVSAVNYLWRKITTENLVDIKDFDMHKECQLPPTMAIPPLPQVVIEKEVPHDPSN